MDDREKRIRDRAYRLWEQEGRPEGRHDSHWHQASQEVGDELFQMQGQQGGTGERRGALDGGLLPQDALIAGGGPAGSGVGAFGMADSEDGQRQQQGEAGENRQPGAFDRDRQAE